MPKPHQPALVADLDGTLRRYSLFADVMNVASGTGCFEAPVINAHSSRIETWLGLLPKILKGRPTDLFDPVLNSELMEQVSRVRSFRFVEPLFKAARESDRRIVIVSRSPQMWVEHYASTMPVPPDMVVGSEMKTVNGRFTGEVVPLDKTRAMARLVAAGIWPTIGMGDTGQDIPLLEAAVKNGGHGVAVGTEDQFGDNLHVRAHGLGEKLPVTMMIDEDRNGGLERCEGPLDSPRRIGAFACSTTQVSHDELIEALVGTKA